MIHFNSKVDILRIAKARDNMGGYAEAESVLYAGLPCRINWTRGSERIMFDKETYYRDAKLYCRIIDADVKDRVRYNGATYEIVNISNVDNLNRYLTLELRLIQ